MIGARRIHQRSVLSLIVAIGWVAGACGEDADPPLRDWERRQLEETAAQNRCTPDDPTGAITPDPGDDVAGVPYPPFEGGTVDASVDLRVFPGAEMVDGFKRSGGPGEGSGKRRVQVYAADAPMQDVLDFYAAQFLEREWAMTGKVYGVTGIDCTYVPFRSIGPYGGDPDDWAVIATTYVGREQDMPEPPGFRGKAVPYAPRIPGKTVFYVITPD